MRAWFVPDIKVRESMDDVTIARAIHVISVVLWIGGVAFVTTVLLPAIRCLEPPRERMRLLEQIEQRFAWQARISTSIVGLTGFYMIYRVDLWDRFRYSAYWWMDAMVGVWLVFVAEPFILHRWLLRKVFRPSVAMRLAHEPAHPR